MRTRSASKRNKPSSRNRVALVSRSIAVADGGTVSRRWTLPGIGEQFLPGVKTKRSIVAPPTAVSPASHSRPKDLAGESSQPSVELGYHVSEQSDPGGLLLSVLGRRYFQPDDRGLDDRRSREHRSCGSRLIDRICQEQGIAKGQLTLHSDNGGPMTGATMVATLERLGVSPSFSRPAVSDDNPYSESLFKTLKYRPSYPDSAFSGIDQARQWVSRFVAVVQHRASS